MNEEQQPDNSTDLDRINSLERQLAQIEARNQRVELDKAWETSVSRRAWVFGVTYLITALVFAVIEAPHPYRNALIPAIAYVLSTLSLPFLRRWWEKGGREGF